MRLASWTAVCGAVAALVYSHFKPFWQNLEWPEVDPDQARGALVAPPSEEASPQQAEARCQAGEVAGSCPAAERRLTP